MPPRFYRNALMIVHRFLYSPALASLMLAGCTTSSASAETQVVNPNRCQSSAVTLDTRFPAGNIASCNMPGERRIKVTITPENAPPINCSAWYAFRLTPRKPGRVTIELNYTACGHRYWPKISEDGQNWTYLPKKAVRVEDDGGVKKARIKVKLGKRSLFVSAQEIIVPATYEAWVNQTAQSPDADRWNLGKSTEGRNIPALAIKQENSAPKEQVLLIGRQHPPEVTGALAMFRFVETLLGNDPLAKRFRVRFETIVVPMLNPDGVTRGHWRHNVGGVDLNRDWGPFTQPETKLMDGLLKEIARDPDKKLRLFMDFHSTQKDVFYSIPDENQTSPPLFIRNWLARLQEKMPNYKVNRDARHDPTRPVSKAYVYEAYGVPTITFELGDETDRKLIGQMARNAAIAMMETLLDTKAPN